MMQTINTITIKYINQQPEDSNYSKSRVETLGSCMETLKSYFQSISRAEFEVQSKH